MTTIARRIIAEPVRTASETWEAIVDLLVPDTNSNGRKELLTVLGVASLLIAAEAIKDAPIVVMGEGPRVRIYGLYGEDAITGENASETSLQASPLSGDWIVSLPCLQEDIEWVSTTLKKQSTHIVARDMMETVDDSEKNTDQKSTVVDRDAFLRP